MSLQRMHRAVDAASAQRFVDFLGEQRLAADVGQRPVLHLVAAGADDDGVDRLRRGQFGMGGTQRGGNFGRPAPAPGRAARADAQQGAIRHAVVFRALARRRWKRPATGAVMSRMLILGIETSCDETAAAVVGDAGAGVARIR